MRRGAFASAVTAAVAVLLAGCDGDPATPADPTPVPTTTAPEITDFETTPAEETTPTPQTTPTGESQTYTVEEGDTLGAIAQRFGTTVEAIVEANDLENPDQIFVGEELQIPGG